MTTTSTPTGTEIRDHVTHVIHARARAAEQLIKDINARRDALRPEHRADDNAGSRLALDLLEHGEPFDPKESAKTAKTDATATLAADLETKRLAAAHATLQQVIRETPADTAAATLDYLRDTLATLVTEARTIAKAHPDTITTGQVERDPTLLEVSHTQARLVEAYRAIRTAQRRTYRATNTSVTPAIINASGMLEDAIDTEAHWTSERRRVSGDREFMSRIHATGRSAQWFDGAPHIPFPPMTASDGIAGDDPWKYLAWIITNAKPWLPEPDELLEAYNRDRERFVKPTSRGRITITN